MKLFDNCIAEYLDFLEVKKYKKGELVFEENSPCEMIGILIKGELKISTLTLLEEEFTIQALHEGDLFGASLIFSEHPFYQGNCEAVKESRVAFISKEHLLKLFSRDQIILQNFLTILSESRIEVQQRLKVFSQKNIKEKILFLIKYKMNEKGEFYFKSKQEVAEYLNIPRPSLSRALIEMQNDGILTFDKHYIKLKKMNS